MLQKSPQIDSAVEKNILCLCVSNGPMINNRAKDA